MHIWHLQSVLAMLVTLTVSTDNGGILTVSTGNDGNNHI